MPDENEAKPSDVAAVVDDSPTPTPEFAFEVVPAADRPTPKEQSGGSAGGATTARQYATLLNDPYAGEDTLLRSLREAREAQERLDRMMSPEPSALRMARVVHEAQQHRLGLGGLDEYTKRVAGITDQFSGLSEHAKRIAGITDHFGALDEHAKRIAGITDHFGALDEHAKRVAGLTSPLRDFDFDAGQKMMRDALHKSLMQTPPMPELRSVHVPLSPRPSFPDKIQVELSEETEQAMDYRAGLADDMCNAILKAVGEYQAELADDEEVVVALANFGARTTISVEEINAHPPHLVEFRGYDQDGQAVCLLQHTSQSNMMLAKRRVTEDRPARRIGFHIVVKESDDE
jgi:hypothetical protein